MRKPETNATVRTLKIEGQDVTATAGQSLLDVCRENGIAVPTLCHLDGLSEIGACRLCVVEVKGIPKLLSACTTEAQEGMDVTVNSERLAKYRRMIVEFLFVERNHICSICVSNGHCELQDLATSLGLEHISQPYRYPKVGMDASHDRFAVDQNRCVLCQRCVRVCDEVEGAHTWDILGRGIGARVITDLSEPWGDSPTCTSCGKCVHVCPTGALFEKGKSAGEMKKRRQFLPYLTLMREEHK